MTVLEYGLSLTTGAFTGPMHGAQSALKGFASQLSNAGNIITGFANIPNAIQQIVEPLSKPISLAADVEVLDKSFRTLLGSGDAAAKMLKDVIKFAAETPFQITEVAPAAKELLAFGFAAKDVIPMLRQIGDMASIMDKPMNQIIEDLGRIHAGAFGRAFMELHELGISMKDLEGEGLRFNKGGEFVGEADQAIEAVRKIMQRKFGGGMQEILGTFKGQFSNLQDVWDQMLTKFGAPITKAITPVISELTKHIEELQPMAASFGKTLATGISGAFALFKSGDLGNTLKTAMVGVGKAFIENIGVGFTAAIQAGAAVLKGIFQSAVSLLSDASFWEGIKNSALSIAYSVKAIILDVAADIVSILPGKQGVAAEWKKTAKSTQGIADAYQQNAAVNFDNVDFDKVVQPLIDSAGSAGEVLGEAITKIADNLKNVPELFQVAESLKNAAVPGMLSGSSLYDLTPAIKPPARLGVAGESFTYNNGESIMDQSSLLDQVRSPKLDPAGGNIAGLLRKMGENLRTPDSSLLGGNSGTAERLLNPSGGDSSAPKAADIQKAIDQANPFKTIITTLNTIAENISALNPETYPV
jgi:hypothetical protein